MTNTRKTFTVAYLAALFLAATALPGAAQGTDAASLAQANNPLAAFKTFNLQNQYNGSLTGTDSTANSFFLRGALPVSAFGGDWLVRATLPINDFPDPFNGGKTNGLGDFNVFAAYLMDTGNPNLSFGIGPQITAPTATEDATGSGKWSAGLANVLFNTATPGFQWGYLLTWQASFAGESDRANVNAGAFQPILVKQLGEGWYLRSTAIWTYDFETDNYDIPIGLGAGRVVQTPKTTINLFAEPQFSVASRGNGQMEWGVFAGVNFQFAN